MRKIVNYILLLVIGFSLSSINLIADEPIKIKNTEFQIHLPKPAKFIRLIMYEKNNVPIQGKISEDKKSIIIKEYESGSKVHVKVEYEDGTIDEFVRSPCYIDPVPV